MKVTEEPIGGLSLLAYRRVSTMIALARVQSGVGQVVTIAPLDPDAALTRPERGDAPISGQAVAAIY